MNAATSYFLPCAIAMALALPVLGCGGPQSAPDDGHGDHGQAGQAKGATATVEPRSESKTTGTAMFKSEGDKVSLTMEVMGAPPGEHAVHIHENPDCSAPDATSAGEHWNPTQTPHGKWGHDGFHLGDIGNLSVAADGTGRLTFTSDKWTVGTGGQNDVAGHSIIIHGSPDDFTSQPGGNAGPRIGCGVIRKM